MLLEARIMSYRCIQVLSWHVRGDLSSSIKLWPTCQSAGASKQILLCSDSQYAPNKLLFRIVGGGNFTHTPESIFAIKMVNKNKEFYFYTIVYTVANLGAGIIIDPSSEQIRNCQIRDSPYSVTHIWWCEYVPVYLSHKMLLRLFACLQHTHHICILLEIFYL